MNLLDYKQIIELYEGCKSVIVSNNLIIESSDDKDIKLNLDFELHHIISEFLKKNTKINVYSEEAPFPNNSFKNIKDEQFWLIDPLDGSLNYSRGLNHYATSIALIKNQEIIIGIILDYEASDIVMGIKDKGVMLNNQRIIKHPPRKTKDAIYCSGIPTYLKSKEKIDMFWKRLIQVQKEVKKIRFLGSATSSIKNVILGKADIYSEDEIAIWDIAAGKLIAEEMGMSVEFKFDSNFGHITISNVE